MQVVPAVNSFIFMNETDLSITVMYYYIMNGYVISQQLHSIRSGK